MRFETYRTELSKKDMHSALQNLNPVVVHIIVLFNKAFFKHLMSFVIKFLSLLISL